MPDDFTSNTSTNGTVAVGGSVTGEIEKSFDLDWFRGEPGWRARPTGSTWSPRPPGELSDPYLRGVYNADGNLHHRYAGTTTATARGSASG